MQYVDQLASFDLHSGKIKPTIKQLRGALITLLKVAPIEARIEIEQYPSNGVYSTRIIARWSRYV